jgi:2-polyprenyl-3-methyl-5-hydroxy-6-metoxy-1,4-benzoquinol methylase
MRTLTVIAAALLLAAPSAAQEPSSSPYTQLAQAQRQPASQTPDVIFVPTPQDVVDDMLRLANVRKGDVLYDLGSGDGRIPITAARRYRIRAVGIDIDPERIREANENARRAGVTNLVQFKQEDLFKADFSDATVVTLYLLPDLNVKLRPRLWEELKPGTRIVSHQFDMGTWKPEKKLESNGRVIYFWTIPERKKQPQQQSPQH